MPYPNGRERRYPPTPYAPQSEATEAYRAAYDLGQRHLGTISGPDVLRYDAGLTAGSPEQQGYRDGVTVAWVRLQKLEQFGREQARRDYLEDLDRRRKSAREERPY